MFYCGYSVIPIVLSNTGSFCQCQHDPTSEFVTFQKHSMSLPLKDMIKALIAGFLNVKSFSHNKVGMLS